MASDEGHRPVHFWYNGAMKVISLQSGSNGNCIYVEANGVKLLFDAGIAGNLVEERLAVHGRDVAVDAVLISHDHIDHCRSMGILNRMFGLPIYATAKTFDAAKRFALGRNRRPSIFRIRGNGPVWESHGGNDSHPA